MKSLVQIATLQVKYHLPIYTETESAIIVTEQVFAAIAKELGMSKNQKGQEKIARATNVLYGLVLLMNSKW
jgi:hypothetical protein